VNFYNLIKQNESFHNTLNEKVEKEKWSKEDKMKLIETIEKHGENWDEILKVFKGKKTRADCILQFIQLPIKENSKFDLFDQKPINSNNFFSNSNVNDTNPVLNQVAFFAKMFDLYSNEEMNSSNILKDKEAYCNSENLKEIIFRTYAKSIDQAQKLKKKEKKKMKKIMNLLIYLQMKKIELKLNYFSDFDKLIQYNKQQIKTMQSQVLADRINLALKKVEVGTLTNKIKDNLKLYSEFYDYFPVNYSFNNNNSSSMFLINGGGEKKMMNQYYCNSNNMINSNSNSEIKFLEPK